MLMLILSLKKKVKEREKANVTFCSSFARYFPDTAGFSLYKNGESSFQPLQPFFSVSPTHSNFHWCIVDLRIKIPFVCSPYKIICIFGRFSMGNPLLILPWC